LELKTIEIVRKPSDLEAVWPKQYVNLAHVFASVLGTRRHRVAEIGCGRGQLTVPLAKRASNLRFVLVDSFVGTNYSKNYKALVRNLRKAGLTKRADIRVSDYMNWITTQKDDTYEAVISSEFMPEIDSDETHLFIQECYRILKPEGVTIHSFLSPIPRNFRQKFLITADSNPLWTRTAPKQWFSPKPELVARELRKSGFHRIRKTMLRAQLIMKVDAAKSWLKSAEVRASFYERHERLLNASGLEVPDWVIVSGTK
jgi:cyclopropane fatty-acyl-phospholipid synthase-like methyltransferase